MNIPLLLSMLKCIHCRSEVLEWKIFSKTDDCGLILCVKCKRYYPIEDGILDCLPDDLVEISKRQLFEERFRSLFPSEVSRFAATGASRPQNQQFTFEEDDPLTYDKKVVADSFWAKAHSVVLNDWSQALKGTAGPLLDVGCGTGRISHMLAAQFSFIIGMDVNIPMLKFAAQKAKKDGLDQKVNYIAGDIWNLPFRDEIFSGLFFFGVLHHLSGPYEALMHLTSVLKRDGVLCGSENNISIFRGMFDLLMKFKTLWEEDDHLEHATLSKESLDQALKKGGFSTRFRTTCFIPPHIYLFLPSFLANALYVLTDGLFRRVPFFSRQGGLIYFWAKR